VGPLVARFEAGAGGDGRRRTRDGVLERHGRAPPRVRALACIARADESSSTSPITFSATAAAAYYVGAKVRIADTDPRTGNLEPASVEALNRPAQRARVVPVHLAGQPADLAPLAALARRHGLRLVEDACHALGATLGATPIGGGDSDAVAFSFHPVKHVTTGEGGAVVVRDPDVKRRLDRLRSHGIERDPACMQARPEGPWGYEVAELGWNYRLPDIACALGLAQLAKLPAFVARRRALAARYRVALAATFGAASGDHLDAPLAPPAELPDRTSAYHLFANRRRLAHFGTTRARVVAALTAARIHPGALHPAAPPARCTPRAARASSAAPAPAPIATTPAPSACPCFPRCTTPMSTASSPSSTAPLEVPHHDDPDRHNVRSR